MRAGIGVLPYDVISISAPFATVLGLNLTRTPWKKFRPSFKMHQLSIMGAPYPSELLEAVLAVYFVTDSYLTKQKSCG